MPKMPCPYVEDIKATRRGNCKSTKETIGKQASVATDASTNAFFCPNTIYTVALKLIVMSVMERNRVNKPRIRLLGKA